MDIPNEAAVFVGLAAGMQLMLIWSAGIAFRSRCADIRRFGAALQKVILSALRRSRKEKTEYDDMVAVEMQTSRCKLASCLICMYAAICFLYLLLMQIQIADVWSPILCWALLAHAGYFTCCLYLPCLLSYDIIYILFIVSTLLYLSPLVVTPSQYVEVSMTLLLSLRIPSVVIPSQIKSVVLCNVAYFIMLTVRIALDWYSPADSEKLRTPHRARVVAMELMGSISVMAFACLVKGFLRKRAEKQVEVGASSKLAQQLNAAIALLHLCCDAVVELDSRLRLREHSPELAAMLLRDFQGASLAEMKLTDFMPVVDASKAMTYLQDFRSTSTSSVSRRREQQAHAFISRLVDSGATKIKVEIFQVMYRTPGGEACHLVGIRDITDSKPFVSDEEMSDELEAPVQEQASSQRSPSPEVPQPGVNRVCLDLDVTEKMIIASATAPLSNLAGTSIAGIFPQSICMLMKRISEEGRLFLGRNEPLPGKTFTFESLPVHWSPDRNAEEICGFFQLTRNMSGCVHVLMYFQNRAKSCVSSPGSPASPLSPFSLSPPSVSRRSSQKDRESRVGRGSRASQQPMTLGSLSTLKL